MALGLVLRYVVLPNIVLATVIHETSRIFAAPTVARRKLPISAGIDVIAPDFIVVRVVQNDAVSVVVVTFVLLDQRILNTIAREIMRVLIPI